MKYIKPASLEDINKGKIYSENLTTEIINEFLKSSLDIAEIDVKDLKMKNIYGNIRKRIEKYKLPIKVVMRRGRVFLVRSKT